MNDACVTLCVGCDASCVGCDVIPCLRFCVHIKYDVFREMFVLSIGVNS